MPDNYFKKYPNKEGFFNEYGGAFIPPVLEVEMKKINDAYYAISKSHNFISENMIESEYMHVFGMCEKFYSIFGLEYYFMV